MKHKTAWPRCERCREVGPLQRVNDQHLCALCTKLLHRDIPAAVSENAVGDDIPCCCASYGGTE